jgi:hypothetical protein
MVDDTADFDRVLIGATQESCVRATSLLKSNGALPRREVTKLRRVHDRLQPTTESETDWKLLYLVLQSTDGFWPRIADLANELTDDPVVDAMVGFAGDGDARAPQLWSRVLAPIFEQYGRRCPDLRWDEDLACQLLRDWRTLHTSTSVPHRSIAPLHNLTGPQERVTIGDGTFHPSHD